MCLDDVTKRFQFLEEARIWVRNAPMAKIPQVISLFDRGR